MNRCSLCGELMIVAHEHKHKPGDYENAAEYTAPKVSWVDANGNTVNWPNGMTASTATSTTAINPHWSAPAPVTDYIEETVTYEKNPDGTLIKKTTSRGVVRGEPRPVPDGSPWPPKPEDPYSRLSVEQALGSETALDEITQAALLDAGADESDELEEYKEKVRKHMRTALGALILDTVHRAELDAAREAELKKQVADILLKDAVNQMINHFRNKAKTMMVETDETIELAPGVYKHAVQKILALCDVYDTNGKSL